MHYQEFFNMKYLVNRVIRIAIIIAIYAIMILVSLRQPARSQVIDSSFYDWTVYEIQDNEVSDKQCYIVSRPIKSESDDVSRKKPYFMIARFQGERNEEVSIYGGFEYKLNSQVFLLVDDYQFKLRADKDRAWNISKVEDAKMISTILQSAVMKIRSDSTFGKYAVDEYSLKGITRAYNRMREICR